LAAYERLGVLANAHPERGPAWACRPFDRRRTGFAVGEGAGVLILESRASVRRRDARPMARLAGWAMGTDPAGLTRLTADGSPLAHVIRQACRRARCTPDAIGCIHAHGTATPNNDLTEARALRAALGEGLAEIPVVSIKGALGHLIGAAGAVELALSVLTVRTARSPGTATLLEADPELAALGLPREAFPMSRRAVLKTSLGFGGHLAAVVIMPA
jgi:3-oxoacyl-(acyl-carrier-protein) synthase